MPGQYRQAVAVRPKVVLEKDLFFQQSEIDLKYLQPWPYVQKFLYSDRSMGFRYFHKQLIHQLSDKPGIQSQYIVYIAAIFVSLSSYTLLHAEIYIRLHWLHQACQ